MNLLVGVERRLLAEVARTSEQSKRIDDETMKGANRIVVARRAIVSRSQAWHCSTATTFSTTHCVFSRTRTVSVSITPMAHRLVGSTNFTPVPIKCRCARCPRATSARVGSTRSTSYASRTSSPVRTMSPSNCTSRSFAWRTTSKSRSSTCPTTI